MLFFILSVQNSNFLILHIICCLKTRRALTILVGEMCREADHVSHHQSVAFIWVDSVLHRYWNIVCHAHVFIVQHRKKGEAYVDCPHCQSIVSRPNPHLHQVISAGKNKQTCYFMDLLPFITVCFISSCDTFTFVFIYISPPKNVPLPPF